ncbi:transferase [Streptomyces cinereoruber]|uniref:Transferase n=1 Tax=Streptomyces cinereoruber TaxID=67260 RepID=A0AAV4KB28_9ACTN|nr:sugar transferase [Streptomyces cinereoruber]MBB4157264.1 lipopolysaccharide/colanic/teichoic acid biosynthesis glycosyltransferase [Streptomyces cinereoruber]MBY8814922.1 sugar transferase [Streptomyces cinereoruber]NIH59638.1 lipopolysaccharide/colanic/teichoic acid biosynthesis glycosyltransferase [Streptomyces cinereoruber]QEV34484.1 sugar transferase [Streptomyces cinereoruber]GGR06919.1 transferase [Streptomyces cinereoruber]
MTTESTSVPSSPGPWPTAGQGQGQSFGLASLAPPRGAPGRVDVPRHRRPRARTRSGAAPLVVADALAVVAAASVLSAAHHDLRLVLPVLALVLVLDGHAGLHRPAAHVRALDELPALASRAGVAWCLAAAGVAAYSPHLAIGPLRLCAAYAVHVLLVCAVRALVIGRRRRVAKAHPRSALVVGGTGDARRFAAAAVQHPEYGVRPVGIVGVPEQGGARTSGEAGLPVLTTTEEIHRAVIQNTVCDAVFLDDDPGLVTLFQQYGCTTWRVGGRHQDGPMGEHMWGYAWHRIVPLDERRGLTAKRALDIALAAPALVLALPVLLLCALAVRLSDGPGVLFRQERVGQYGRHFTLLKFRTLRPSDDTESATRWNVAGDRRMSAAGSFLRKTSLDELPQLWNVLRGDMSLVGPRPERPYFVAQFSKVHAGYAARHRMPVGLTGLAQVHGLRGDTSIEDRCRFDNHYIDHWSLWQDVCILLRTAAELVRPTGS